VYVWKDGGLSVGPCQEEEALWCPGFGPEQVGYQFCSPRASPVEEIRVYSRTSPLESIPGHLLWRVGFVEIRRAPSIRCLPGLSRWSFSDPARSAVVRAHSRRRPIELNSLSSSSGESKVWGMGTKLGSLQEEEAL
jgi:hypothetical protein